MAEIKETIQKQESKTSDSPERTRSGKVFIPASDIIETANEIYVVADMPGVNEKSIDVTLENNQLTIQGLIQLDVPENHRLMYKEYDVGDFYRSFTISDTIDRDKIQASYKNGVLRLTLPKAEKLKPRQISVNIE